MSRDHDHRHPSPADAGKEPTTAQKLATLLEYWMKHNVSHAQTYREWAEKAAALSMDEVCARLKEAVDLTLALNLRFEEALKRIREQG